MQSKFDKPNYAVGACFAVNVFAVGFNRAYTDTQIVGYLPVAVLFKDQLEYFSLFFGE
jgi:hypothetical protein